jgi:uncharacterized damage-inducible protein DinB
MSNELERFTEIWEREAGKTVRLLEALPPKGYDFRPDPDARSLGELAWHLAEAEGYGTFAIEQGGFSRHPRPPGIERPRTIRELSDGFARIHRDALARVQNLRVDNLDRSITSFNGEPIKVRDVLWDFMLLHGIHHRGQLVVMCRQAGGRPPALFGPTRETTLLGKPKR